MPYNSCKAGVSTLAKSLSKACSTKGVLINVISPAFVETPLTDAMMEQRASSVNGCNWRVDGGAVLTAYG